MYMKPLTSVSTVIYFTINLAEILFSFSFVNHTVLVVVMAFWCSKLMKFIIVEILDILCWFKVYFIETSMICHVNKT